MRLINKHTLSPFDYILIIGVVSLNLAYSILNKEVDLIGSISAISGLLCVVLVAKGNILNYVFGVINVSLYAYISYKSELYGDAALNALYYLPMQVVGWLSWKNRKSQKDSTKIQGRKMNLRQRLIWGGACIASVVLGGFILKYLGDPQPFKDSATTILSIIAMYLMVRAYMEQWILWIIVNIISIAMWTLIAIEGGDHAELMIIMWIFYLANSVNGFRIWFTKISK